MLIDCISDGLGFVHFISKENDLDGLAPYKLPGAEISWFARTPLSVSQLGRMQ